MSRLYACAVTPRPGPLVVALGLICLGLACADPPPAPSPVTTPTPAPTVTTPPPPPAPATARYEVRFESVWAAATHPIDFPDNAHYSPLIGATHDAMVSFWQVGERASEGIRAMAERGRTSPLDQEIGLAIAAGHAAVVLRGDALDSTPGATAFSFDVGQQFARVTLVTMVAPSPDWFVGVSGLPLFDGEAWVDTITVDLRAHDAGTDSGVTFESPDEPSVPAALIQRIDGYPITRDPPAAPLGRFVFTRQ